MGQRSERVEDVKGSKVGDSDERAEGKEYVSREEKGNKREMM